MNATDFLINLVSAANSSRSAAEAAAVAYYSAYATDEEKEANRIASAVQYAGMIGAAGLNVATPSFNLTEKAIGKGFAPLAFIALLSDLNKARLAFANGISEEGLTAQQSQAAMSVMSSALTAAGLGVAAVAGGVPLATAIAAAGLVAGVLSAFPEFSDAVVDFTCALAETAPDTVLAATQNALSGQSLFGASESAQTIAWLRDSNVVEELAARAVTDPDVQAALMGGNWDSQGATTLWTRNREYWEARAAYYLGASGYGLALPEKYRSVNFIESTSEGYLYEGGSGRIVFLDESDAGTVIEYGTLLDDAFYGDDTVGGNALRGQGGDDVLWGFGGNDVLDGGAGADKLYGGAGDDWLGYTAANLNAGSVDELDSDGNFYHGGTGNDRVYGSKAADTFWFEAGDEQDVIRGNGGADELWYAAEGQAPFISREGKNLVLTGQGQDRIVLEDWYADNEASTSRLERLVLTRKPAQGQAPEEIGVVSGAYLHQRGLTKNGSGEIRGDLDRYQETLVGSDAVDFIYASQSHDGIHGGDILVGGKGDDFLYGSIGADKVRVSAGDGKEVYRGLGGADIVEFHGGLDIDSSAVLIDRVMNDLRITFEDGTAITIKDWDEEGPLMAFRNGTDGPLVGYSEMSLRVKRFFGDGNDNYYVVTTPTSQKVYGSGGNDTLLGSDADDLLDGGNGNDILFGGAGNDQLWGQAGNDRLYGGTGNDNLYGNAGQDALWGEAGNDLLVGGDDDDHLWGDAGQDTLWGGAGSDTLEGGDDNDWLYAEAGNDVLKGGAGSNIMTGGAGNDTFHAEGSRDEMWGGGDFDTYILTPTGAGTQKLIFEDAQGGLVDLSAYAQAGVGIHLLRSAADQLILTSSQGETIVVNGWAHQSTSLLVGSQTWDYARVQNALSEKYGYTYDNVWRAAEFSSVVAQLSPFFAKAVAHYGEYSVQSVFADGLSAMVSTGLSRDGANIYRWGWKAGTLSEQALSEGVAYQGDVLTLFEDNRTRSSALLTMPQALSDPHPVDRVDMWYDFWDDPVYGWSFAVVDAYSAEASTATLNPDGTISPSAEYNKVVNAHDPATWGLLHPARNSFQLLAGP